MNDSCSRGQALLVLPILLLLACALFTVADAKGLPQLPDPGDPSHRCGCSRVDDTIPLSSGMLSSFLPHIPNLELGYQYSFGNNVRTRAFTADYVLPFRLSSDSVLFGEAHAEGRDFWKSPTVSVPNPAGFTTTTTAASNRVDLSIGGGYRTMLGASTFLGVNGFYDTSRLFNTWYSSGGVGLEFAASAAGDDAIDLSFNWYGNLFNRDVLVNAFRNKGNSFDAEVGYSHALFDHAMDLRLKVVGYQFDIGDTVGGWRCGTDLTTRNGVLTLRYEYGRDRLNGDYNTVGGFVTAGFNLGDVLEGESPFTLPAPVFRSPRDLRRLLGLKVKRNWHQPEAVVLAKAAPSPTSLLCPHFRGSIARLTQLGPGMETFRTDPPIPDRDPLQTQVRICWCGLKKFPVEANWLRFYDGTGDPLARSVGGGPGVLVFTARDGCMVRGFSLGMGGDNSWNHVVWEGLWEVVEFDTGGGLSFEFF